MPDNVAMFATVIVLIPMFYLFLAAPAFLLVKLDIVPVARLFRGMFDGYFIVLSVAAAIGALAVALEGRWGLAVFLLLICVASIEARRWFLSRMQFDTERDRVEPEVARRLRRLHWGGMAANAAQLAILLICIPSMAVASI